MQLMSSIRNVAKCVDDRMDGYKPMTEHDWPERRTYEALALRDICAEAATGERPRFPEPARLFH
jgi:hypothetical protein